MQSVTHCRMEGNLDWPGTGCVCSLDLGHTHSSWMGNSLDESQLMLSVTLIDLALRNLQQLTSSPSPTFPINCFAESYWRVQVF